MGVPPQNPKIRGFDPTPPENPDFGPPKTRFWTPKNPVLPDPPKIPIFDPPRLEIRDFESGFYPTLRLSKIPPFRGMNSHENDGFSLRRGDRLEIAAFEIASVGHKLYVVYAIGLWGLSPSKRP